VSISLAPALAPKKPAWLKASAFVAFVAMTIYIGYAWARPWQPGRFWGLLFGTLAAVLFFNAGLYPLRRRLRAKPFATVQQWLQLHIYGSLIALLFVLIHIGFRLPAGMFGWWLFILSVWASLTGIVGVLLQKWVPVMIARNLKVEAILERIPELSAKLAAEADTVAAGAGEALMRTYQDDIKPLLAGPQPRWGYLFDIRQARVRQVEPLTRIETFVEGADRDRLRDLTVIVNEKLDLDVHLSLQRALRAWLVTHIPAAIVLLGLLVIHVFAVLYF
jgi:hypothetical protein